MRDMSAPKVDILVVDDDASIREALCDYLGGHGFDVRAAANAAQMDAHLQSRRPNLVVLDLMMPGEDGLSVARRLSGDVPILMLSAMGETQDRIVGLEVGADDYLPKPFEPRELLARIRSLLRRKQSIAAAPAEGLYFEGWYLDLSAQLLFDPEGTEVSLTAGEYALLKAFVEHPRRLLTRDQLLTLSRGPLTDSFDRAVDLSVSRLRRKLYRAGETELIETVRGQGYRFAVPVVPR